jgi:hypothetical protein
MHEVLHAVYAFTDTTLERAGFTAPCERRLTEVFDLSSYE